MTLLWLWVTQQHDVSPLIGVMVFSNATWTGKFTHRSLSNSSKNCISFEVFNIFLYVLKHWPSKPLFLFSNNLRELEVMGLLAFSLTALKSSSHQLSYCSLNVSKMNLKQYFKTALWPCFQQGYHTNQRGRVGSKKRWIFCIGLKYETMGLSDFNCLLQPPVFSNYSCSSKKTISCW